MDFSSPQKWSSTNMAVVRHGLLCLVLVGMWLSQLTAASTAEAPTVATAMPFFGAEIGMEMEMENQQGVAAGPEIRRLGKHHLHTSMAGGGVLLGGLATAVFAVVFCYIRVTRKPDPVK
ncbi:uncharacterized protein LOC111794654 [Cucurbita pepo subsp. pepo]|uniref:uncharacterized protein LOC111794654 n=1 Tax=Cucurbita pepo subsp. pepo TaxID=3664 RepID=UPI000C9D3338|nr:uncharacterized protein LOC111794654 [Cucurbita pepo subsp. pepo]